MIADKLLSKISYIQDYLRNCGDESYEHDSAVQACYDMIEAIDNEYSQLIFATSKQFCSGNVYHRCSDRSYYFIIFNYDDKLNKIGEIHSDKEVVDRIFDFDNCKSLMLEYMDTQYMEVN